MGLTLLNARSSLTLFLTKSNLRPVLGSQRSLLGLLKSQNKLTTALFLIPNSVKHPVYSNFKHLIYLLPPNCWHKCWTKLTLLAAQFYNQDKSHILTHRSHNLTSKHYKNDGIKVFVTRQGHHSSSSHQAQTSDVTPVTSYNLFFQNYIKTFVKLSSKVAKTFWIVWSYKIFSNWIYDYNLVYWSYFLIDY